MAGMANGGYYQQQWPQPPPQRQYPYDQQYDPRARQGSRQGHRMPRQNIPQYYDDYGYPQQGYDDYAGRGYEQGQWQDQYQDPYASNGPPRGPYPPRGRGYDRPYGFDGRPRLRGGMRPPGPPQGGPYGYEDGRGPPPGMGPGPRSREQRRPEQMMPERRSEQMMPERRPEQMMPERRPEQMMPERRPEQMMLDNRPRTRERMAPMPTSPDTLAWDNPFGAFPPKKNKHSKHASLDKALSGLQDGPPPEEPPPRPQTSHDHRRQPEPRPHTSHGHRTDSVESPRFPDQPMPLQKEPLRPMRREGPPGPGGAIGLPSRPAPQRAVTQPSPHSSSHDLPTDQYRNGDAYGFDQQDPRAYGGRPIPQRGPPPPNGRRPSAPDFTQPMPRPTNPNYGPQPPRPRIDMKYGQPSPKPRSDENFGQLSPRPANDDSYGQRPPRPRPTENGNALPSRPGPENSYKRSASRPRPDDGSNQLSPRPLDDEPASQPSSRPRTGEDNNSYRGIPLTKPSSNRSTEIPNFEAIPSPATETAEDLFPMPPANEQPAYTKKSYQAFPAPDPRQQARLEQQAKRSQTGRSPYEQSPPNTASDRYEPQPQREMNSYQSGPQSPIGENNRQNPMYYNPRLAPSRSHTDPLRQQSPVTQNPPRTSSRAGQRSPPSERNAASPTIGLPLNPQQISRRPVPGDSQRRPPQGNDYTNGPNGQDRGYDQPYAMHDNNQTGNQPSYDTARNYPPNQPYRDQSNALNERPLPSRPKSQENYAADPVAPQPSQSGHPVPVRHYGDRTSSDLQQPTLPSASGDSNSSRAGTVQSGNQGGVKQAVPIGLRALKHQREPKIPKPEVSSPASQRGPVDDKDKKKFVTVPELNGLQTQYKQNPDDVVLGLKLAKKLIEAASVLASDGGRLDAKQTAKNRERYILDGHKLVKKLVAAGYPEAMFYLADCYGQGRLGLAQDPKEAFQLYQSAAKLNHPQAAYRVAVCCELGSEEGGGTRRDPQKAMQWYKRAAAIGDTAAMYKMGMIMLKGLLGQPRNSRDAVSWLKRAADRADAENPHALHELGLLYESASPTDHIVRDEQYALQLFSQAAEYGYKYSQFRLGSAYEYGLLGCPVDPRQSISWYTRAAAQGEHQSELALSGWYLTGSEPLLPQSDIEAYLWARKAASSGLAKAEYAMGYFTETGIGTVSNMEEAKRWYYRAAAQNFNKARERLEDLRKGGQVQKKARVSRSNVNKNNEGECTVM